MSPHHSDQIKGPKYLGSLFEGGSLNVFAFVFVIIFLLVRSCLLIALIECLKIHKSLGSLCSVVKTLIVSGVRGTDQGTDNESY